MLFKFSTINVFSNNHHLTRHPSYQRLVFLDVDGVLAIQPRVLDPHCVWLLCELLRRSEAHIVVSSTWRYSLGGKQLLLSGLVHALVG